MTDFKNFEFTFSLESFCKVYSILIPLSYSANFCNIYILFIFNLLLKFNSFTVFNILNAIYLIYFYNDWIKIWDKISIVRYVIF